MSSCRLLSLTHGGGFDRYCRSIAVPVRWRRMWVWQAWRAYLKWLEGKGFFGPDAPTFTFATCGAFGWPRGALGVGPADAHALDLLPHSPVLLCMAPSCLSYPATVRITSLSWTSR